MGKQQGSAISDLLNIAGLAYHNGQPAEPYTVPDGYSLMDQGSNAVTGFNGATFYNGDTVIDANGGNTITLTADDFIF